jgi:hypothetical protein
MTRNAAEFITEVIELSDAQELAKCWAELGRGHWPESLPVDEPNTFEICYKRGFLTVKGCADRGTIAGAVYWGILDKVGLREALRYQMEPTHPGESFDTWWHETTGDAKCHTS